MFVTQDVITADSPPMIVRDDDVYLKLAKRTKARFSNHIPEEYSLHFDFSQYKQAIATGIIPLKHNNGSLAFWHAPEGAQLSIFLKSCKKDVNFGRSFILCTPQAFRELLREKSQDYWCDDAINNLKTQMPHYSSSRKQDMQRAALIPALFIALVICLYFVNQTMSLVSSMTMTVFFLGWLLLRLILGLIPPPRQVVLPKLTHFPLYSIVVPLYKEAQMVQQLLANIAKIDYPKERLDIKLVCEAGDDETILALKQSHYDVIVAPAQGPKTKPKALMLALPYLRGEFMVVYDAEDEPHPMQLQEAVHKFMQSEASVLQAPLFIGNGSKNFQTALFAADYTALFTVLLPALARLKFPLPLGGTSNHFRVSDLRKIGGWDPYNVTEDADLGLRLARFGLYADTITLGTREDAPESFMVWLKQRTRWYKGWCQTLYVHFRQPRELVKTLSLWRVIALFAMLGSQILSTLIHPIALYMVCFCDLYAGLLVIGYLVAAINLNNGIKMRFLWFIPLYWLMLSLASYRALWELYRRPYMWEKTPHIKST